MYVDQKHGGQTNKKKKTQKLGSFSVSSLHTVPAEQPLVRPLKLIMTFVFFLSFLFFPQSLTHVIHACVHPLSRVIGCSKLVVLLTGKKKNVFGNDLVPLYSDICTFYLLYLLKYNIMCRDVIYIFVLHSSRRNYRNTNSDATSHLVTAVKC